MMITAILLVFTTLIMGLNVDQSPYFLFIECLINLLILVDFLCRVRLLGVRRFFKEGGWWNIFDAVVVGATVILYGLMMLSKSGALLILEEISEEILLVAWSVFQTLRMIFIAKKQKLA